MATKNEKSGGSVFLDTTSAQYALDKLNAKIDAYDKQLKQTNLTQRELASLQNSRADVAEKAASIQLQIEKGLGATLVQQKKYVSDLTKEMSLLAVGTQAWIDKGKQVDSAVATLLEMKKRQAEVTGAVNDTTKATGFWAKNLDNIKSFFIAGGLLELAKKALGSIKGFFKDAFDEALQAEEKTARLKNQLDNLGRTDVFDRMIAKANEMAARFKYIDNDDVTGVFEHLIDFGKLTEKQMNELLPVIINFAAKQRISLDEASTTLTKFIETGKGLKGFGLDVKDAKDESERLALVMDDLAKKVTGAGEAFQKSATGGIATAKQELKDLKEEVGTGLIPVMINALSVFDKLLTGAGFLLKRLGNFLSDAIDLFTGDVAVLYGEGKGKLDRAVAEQIAINKKVVDAFVAQFKDKSSKEIQDAIDERIRTLGGKQKVLNADIRAGREEDIKQGENAIKIIKAQLYELHQLKDFPSTGIIGVNGGNGDDAAAKAREKAEAEAKRIAELHKQLLEDLQKLEHDISLKTLAGFDKELAELDFKYDALRQRESATTDDLKRIQADYLKDRLILVMQFARKEVELWQKQQKELSKDEDDRIKNNLKNFAELQKRLGDNLLDSAKGSEESNKRRKAFDIEYKELTLHGKKKLDFELDLLDKEEKAAIDAAGIQEREKESIEKLYEEKKKERQIQYWTEIISFTLQYAQQALNIFAKFSEAKSNEEQSELARQQRQNDKNKASYQKLLNGKLISQQEYNRRVAADDNALAKQKEEYDKKEFDRKKKLSILQAVINGAQGITKAVAEYPFPLNLIPIGFAIATTAAEIVTINKQKYGKGGLLNGPAHSDGGMPVINPRTGAKEAEVEGGEVILSKKTVKNNPALVGTLLNSSLHRDGARIDPFWKNTPYKSFDYAGINRTIQRVRHFENGGVIQTSVGSQQAAAQQPLIINQMSEQQEQLLKLVLDKLQKPSKSYVVYSEIQAAGDKLDQIKDNAIFK